MGPMENCFFIIVLDTLCINDSIQLASGNIELYFYYHRMSPFFLGQNGYTTELEGYLVIDSLRDDNLSGTVRFSGEAVGYYHSNEISDDEVESWVSGDIIFTAVKREVKEDSMVVGRILGPLKKEKSND
jgi:hypothetical protein